MSAASNTKLIFTGAALLIAIVSCSVVFARVITNDDTSPEVDDETPTSAKIVENIRTAMKNNELVNIPIQAYIIPSVDAHQNEDVADHDRRARYVSEFTGTYAKIVIIESAIREKAVLWTDNRYFEQAKKQLKEDTWTVMNFDDPTQPTFEEWLVKTLPDTSRIGIDPFLIEAKEFCALNEHLAANGGRSLVAITKNLVDVVWKNQPDYVFKDLELIENEFSGMKIKEKLANVRKIMVENEVGIYIVTSLEDIAWLLNLRGTDTEYSAVFFSYVIITQKNIYWYLMKPERATDSAKVLNHFQTEFVDVEIYDYANNNILAGINFFIRNVSGKILLSSASEAIQSVVIPADRRIEGESLITKMRIKKNDNEAKKMREAHEFDGAAIVRYLYWLDTEIDDQKITEKDGADKLKNLKSSQHESFRKLSYETVSAVGAHAAIARPHECETQITRKEIYLISSGTHYKGGTTDMSRTVHFGTPKDVEKDAFTRVLKGFISVATAVFPPNAPFSFFDAMARRYLWEIGKDYDHPTGHGIGAYLNVHEYPPLLSSENMPGGMCKDMFTTNEPGYYEDTKFGIRIGNVLQVVEVPDSSKYFNGKGAYKFEDITMVPIQTKMINVNLLSQSEIDWLNQYHERVFANISPKLNDNSNIIDWLQKATKPISKKTEDCNEITTATPSEETTIKPPEK